MVLLRFTQLIDKVLAHVKTQTIRFHTEHREKYPLKESQKLQVYLLFKIGEATITKVETKKLKAMTEQDAQKDGFNTLRELDQALLSMHNLDYLDLDNYEKEWDIITFEPEWDPMKLIEIKQLEEMAKEVQIIFDTYGDDQFLEHNIPTLMKLIATKKGDKNANRQ